MGANVQAVVQNKSKYCFLNLPLKELKAQFCSIDTNDKLVPQGLGLGIDPAHEVMPSDN